MVKSPGPGRSGEGRVNSDYSRVVKYVEVRVRVCVPGIFVTYSDVMQGQEQQVGTY